MRSLTAALVFALATVACSESTRPLEIVDGDLASDAADTGETNDAADPSEVADSGGAGDDVRVEDSGAEVCVWDGASDGGCTVTSLGNGQSCDPCRRCAESPYDLCLLGCCIRNPE